MRLSITHDIRICLFHIFYSLPMMNVNFRHTQETEAVVLTHMTELDRTKERLAIVQLITGGFSRQVGETKYTENTSRGMHIQPIV